MRGFATRSEQRMGRARRLAFAAASGAILLTAASPAAAQHEDPRHETRGAAIAPSRVLRAGAALSPASAAPGTLGATAPRPFAPAPVDSGRPSTAVLALGGTVGAAVGWFGGAYAGYKLDRAYFHWDCENGCEDPGLIGLIGGMVVGPALTTPLATHLVNGRRGSLRVGYLASAAIAGVSAFTTFAAGAPGFAVLVAPLAHVLTAVLIERDTSEPAR